MAKYYVQLGTSSGKPAFFAVDGEPVKDTTKGDDLFYHRPIADIKDGQAIPSTAGWRISSGLSGMAVTYGIADSKKEALEDINQHGKPAAISRLVKKYMESGEPLSPRVVELASETSTRQPWEMKSAEYADTQKDKKIEPGYQQNRKSQIAIDHTTSIMQALQGGRNVPADVIAEFRVERSTEVAEADRYGWLSKYGGSLSMIEQSRNKSADWELGRLAWEAFSHSISTPKQAVEGFTKQQREAALVYGRSQLVLPSQRDKAFLKALEAFEEKLEKTDDELWIEKVDPVVASEIPNLPKACHITRTFSLGSANEAHRQYEVHKGKIGDSIASDWTVHLWGGKNGYALVYCTPDAKGWKGNLDKEDVAISSEEASEAGHELASFRYQVGRKKKGAAGTRNASEIGRTQ